MFLNYSNHPSYLWGENQIKEAKKYGDIVDVPFPQIPADFEEASVKKMAESEYERIKSLKPMVVLCQGEMTFCHNIVNRLTENGITVVAACSERVNTEKLLPEGRTIKQVVFEFVRFRKYF